MNHIHLLVHATLETPPTTEEQVEQFLLNVVEAADMKVLVAPKAVRCDTPGNIGVTGTVVIETSHASIHVWEDASPPYLQMDLYSCKDFNPQAIIDCLQDFTPIEVKTLLVDRNNGDMKVVK